jgi:hypothetical protein
MEDFSQEIQDGIGLGNSVCPIPVRPESLGKTFGCGWAALSSLVVSILPALPQLPIQDHGIACAESRLQAGAPL